MLKTVWGEKLDPAQVLPEYPRPQLKRDSYLNLNGYWDHAITTDEAMPTVWDGPILVPFSPESALSGVERTLQKHETLWYHRSLTLPEGFIPHGGRLLLHFGAVDQEATIYLNDIEMGCHVGGYNAFTIDLTDGLCEGANQLTVKVKDETDAGSRSRGKQKTKRGGIWYTPQSGIWQTVWLEAVPGQYIHSLQMLPHIDTRELELTIETDAFSTAAASVVIRGETHTVPVNRPTLLPIRDVPFWSPETPHLESFSVTLGEDRVESYFAMRSFGVGKDEKGIPRLLLNGKPYFHNGLLDQGYWPDGLYTAPSDEALIFDIQQMKALGFNMLRKHIKVEPMRWYYHCDRLGMLVWQDMPSGGSEYKFPIISAPLVTGIHLKDKHYRWFAREDEVQRDAYYEELEEMILQLRNVPSIAMWVPFNEGWGQFDAANACELISELDPTRPIDHASGWHDQGIGQLQSLHVYFRPYRFKPDKRGRAVVLSEFGGYNLRVDGHCFNEIDFGYKKLKDENELWAAYEKLYREQILPAAEKGLAATVYTQVSDVEDELNGLFTYDRAVLKLPADKLTALNAELMKR
ncbi:MAG: glycoside hydrolase family 2 [Clostridiales bacterium]|nr:glycoside hydrolase family 2 [Clostridiales bacterium]